ncbi:MAG TPA: glycosyltransferase 87 family protein, partial [Ktedonobacterales bacterium]|nr:glycosyltransferase 87 family protein [Ktedonobacterales bacterium]
FYTAAANESNWRYLPNYLPLGMYLFGGLTAAYAGVAHLQGLSPSLIVPANATLTVVMKLPAILADLAITVLIYAIARRKLRTRWALLASASYAFSLGPFLDTAVWGQTDGVVLLPVLLALVFTLRRAGLWVGVWFALAIMVKPTPALFLPLSLVYLYRWAGWRQALSAIGSLVGVSAVVCLPYILPPHPQLLVWPSIVAAGSKAMPSTTSDAYNLWLLVAPTRNALHPLWGSVSPSVVGNLMFFGALAVVLAGVWADASPLRLWSGASLIALSYFTLTAMQHERYLYPAVALLLISALYDARRWLFYIVASATVFLNILLAGLFRSPADTVGTALAHWRVGLIASFGLQFTLLAILCAGANIWLTATALTLYVRAARQGNAEAGATRVARDIKGTA